MAANPFPDALDGRLQRFQGTKDSTGSRRFTKPLAQLGFLGSRSLVTAFYTYPELTPGTLTPALLQGCPTQFQEEQLQAAVHHLLLPQYVTEVA